MYFTKLPNKVLNARPLVFLCGPYIEEDDKKDRRNIFRKYLTEQKKEVIYKNSTYTITPFALVIDKLFDDTEINEKTNITLIEEIVAACAFKNYIFVDTMSTALELGLFSNSYAQNKTTALLPTDYYLFKPSIGYFVTETLKKSQNITLCKYRNRRYNKVYNNGQSVSENLIGFRTNILPREIVREVQSDFSAEAEKYLLYIEFTKNKHEHDKLYFEIVNNQLEIYVPPKVLLYLVNQYTSTTSITRIVLEYFKQNICNDMPEHMITYYLIKSKKMPIILYSSFKYDFNDVVENMIYLISSINRRFSSPQRFKKLEYRKFEMFRTVNKTKFYELIGFRDEELSIIKKKFIIRSKAVTKKHLYINGKKRTIIMYKGTSEGYELRSINKKIADNLNKLITLHHSSYAYQKSKSVLSCVKKHLGSRYFLKLDINNFFGSISKGTMNKIVKTILSDNAEEMYISNLTGKTSNYKSSIIDSWEGTEKILDLCFVNGKLPLGLVSSPILSNIYMDYFDRRLCEKFPEIIYTRYSDDILISSPNKFDFEEVKAYICEEIKLLKLEINKQKTHYYQLREAGDHIKYLGLNIVRGRNENYVTVGKKHIKRVCKNAAEFLRGNNTLKKSQIIGQIEYLKYISEEDYKEFEKYFKIKTGNVFEYSKFKKIHNEHL